MTRPTLRRGTAQTLIPADLLLDAISYTMHNRGSVIVDCFGCDQSHEVDIHGTVDLDWLYETIEQLISESEERA